MAIVLPHLPDLPNAGYSTTKQKALSDAIMFFMRDVERHRLRLLSIVIEGKDRWRTVAKSIWSGLLIDDSILDDIFYYFVLQAAQSHHRLQMELLRARQNPPKQRLLIRELIPKIEQEREGLRLMEKWKP